MTLSITQNHPYYESFINYISLTDAAKKNSECYATMKKIKARKSNVPDVYVEFSDGQSKALTFTVHLKFKIPVSMFMMLANLKWYPCFMGDLTFEVQTTYMNLVVTAVGSYGIIHSLLEVNPSRFPQTDLSGGATLSGTTTNHTYDLVYNTGDGFVQINNAAANGIYYIASTTNAWQLASQTFTASTSTLQKFQLYTAFYMLKMDIYNALEYNYLQVPLLFPIQTVSNVKFTSAPGSSSSMTLQNTATLSHCDTVFVIFLKTLDDRTCFKNPVINFQLNINGKFYPRELYSTNDDPLFYNLELDALSINNNPLISISDDVRDSIVVCDDASKKC